MGKSDHMQEKAEAVNMPSVSAQDVMQGAWQASAAPMPLAGVLSMLRCPATGQELRYGTVAGAPMLASADGTRRYAIADGVPLFVTGSGVVRG